MTLKLCIPTFALFMILAISGVVIGAGAENQPGIGDAVYDLGTFMLKEKNPYFKATVPTGLVKTAYKNPNADFTKWYDPVYDDLGWGVAKDSATLGSQVPLPGAKTGFTFLSFYLTIAQYQKENIIKLEDKLGITDFWLSVLPHEPLDSPSGSSSGSSGKPKESVPTNKQSVKQPVDPLPIAALDVVSIGTPQLPVKWQETSTSDTVAALDALSIGTPQSNVKWQETSTNTNSKSNAQETVQNKPIINAKDLPIGSTVETTDSLNVRSGPGLSYNTVSEFKTTGSTATILSGPYYADGFTWWEMQYNDGTKGYSQDKRLELEPANQQTVTQQATVPARSQSNSAKFIKGSKVETTDSLNVRSGPGLSYNTVSNFKTTGSTATIIKGPFYADGFTWWELQYDDGTSGWSQDKRLELVPANQPPVTQQVDQHPVTKSNELAFGDNQLSVTQPVDQQPKLTFGDNLQPATQYKEQVFGDNQLSVTQPVDQQPKLTFGDNPQLSTQLKERVFGDNQLTGDLQPYTQPQESNFMQLSGTQFGDYPELAQNNGYGNHIGKEHDRKYVTYFDNIRKGYYKTPARTKHSPRSTQPKSKKDSSGSLRGLTPEQLRAIQEWIDSGAGQAYDPPVVETNPVFAQCYDGACYDAKGERIN